MSTEERAENVERELATARHVDLVDAKGQTHVMVRTGKDGPKLLLLDKNGEWSAILYVTEDGPVKILFGEKGDLREVINVPTDKMHLYLYDAAQKLHSSLGMGDVPSIVELRNAEDKTQVVIRADRANLEFLLHDAGDRMRVSLAMGKDAGRLRLFDEKGEAIWSAP